MSKVILRIEKETLSQASAALAKLAESETNEGYKAIYMEAYNDLNNAADEYMNLEEQMERK